MRLPRRRNAGFTYVETAISTVILALAVVAALQAYGTCAKGLLIDRESAAAAGLAAEMIAEVTSRDFEDAEYSPGSFGLGAGESSRVDFDDVDDYDGWCESPPLAADGTELTEYADYVRCVTVSNVDEATLSLTRADGSTAAKRIMVTVTRHGRKRAQLEAIRIDSETGRLKAPIGAVLELATK